MTRAEVSAATPSATGSTVERVVERMREAIRTGAYSPGQRLIASDLVSELDVSLSVIRESFRILAGFGLLELHPNKGAQVKALTAADVEEIYQAREVIEGQAARLAAARIDMTGLRVKLSSTMAAMERVVEEGDFGLYQAENRRFHQTILAMAGNRRLTEIAEHLLVPIYRLQLHQLIRPSAVAESAREHRGIATAILAGEARRAERLMRAHIRASGVVLVSGFNAERPSPGPEAR